VRSFHEFSLAATGDFDLVVIGAEHRAIKARPFFGHDNERLLAHTDVATVIVMPNIARLRQLARAGVPATWVVRKRAHAFRRTR
jgi:hypothetical protein